MCEVTEVNFTRLTLLEASQGSGAAAVKKPRRLERHLVVRHRPGLGEPPAIAGGGSSPEVWNKCVHLYMRSCLHGICFREARDGLCDRESRLARV